MFIQPEAVVCNPMEGVLAQWLMASGCAENHSQAQGSQDFLLPRQSQHRACTHREEFSALNQYHTFLIRKGKIMKNCQYYGMIQMAVAHQLAFTFKSPLNIGPIPENVSHIMLKH